MSSGNGILRRRSVLLLQKREGMIRGVIVEMYDLNNERENFVSSVRKVNNAANHYCLRNYDISGDGNIVIIPETRLSIKIEDLFEERLKSQVLFKTEPPLQPCPKYIWEKEGDDKGKEFYYGTLESRRKDDSQNGKIWGTTLTKAKPNKKSTEKSSETKEDALGKTESKTRDKKKERIKTKLQ